MTDWSAWHEGYADAGSDLSRRLAVVEHRVRTWADAAPAGPLRLISLCAGQGHDVVGALAPHARRLDVTGLLVESDRGNVAVARREVRRAELPGIAVVQGDAARLDTYRDAVPADLVLVCGVFGNISDRDVRRTIAALPSLVAAGATVVWTRHRRAPDLTGDIRLRFGASGFEELDFTSPAPDRFAVGTHRLARPPDAFSPDAAGLFTFTR